MAPVVEDTAEFGWDEAKSLVDDAYRSFSPEIADVVLRDDVGPLAHAGEHRQVLEDRRLDVAVAGAAELAAEPIDDLQPLLGLRW